MSLLPLASKTGQITFYTYDLIRDESDRPIKKIYLQRIIKAHSYSIKQLPKILTPQNRDLFSRPICFIKRDDIASLPDNLRTNGWARFFEAMYFIVPSKNCPTSMAAEEKETKTNNLEESIRILTDLTTSAAETRDPSLLPIVHQILGIIYFRALGVESDYQKAFSHFQFAADHGLTEARVYLGTFYGNGIAVIKDTQKAIDLFKQAAQMGSIEALYQLGNIHAIENNKIESSTPYFEKAAQNGHPISLFWLGYLKAEQAKSTQSTKKQRRSLKKAAVQYYKRAAELDCVTAQLALGQAYIYGYLGLSPNTFEAIRYLSYAKQNRSAEGASNLGVIYTKSDNHKENRYEEGLALLLKSCRYSPKHLDQSVSNINQLLQSMNRDHTDEKMQQMVKKLSKQASDYFLKHHIAVSIEKQTTIAPDYDSAKNRSNAPLTTEESEKNYRAFIEHGKSLRDIHLKTLSTGQREVFLQEEDERPARSKELVAHFLPTLSHFTLLYTDFKNQIGEDNPDCDFFTFVKKTNTMLTEDTQTFLLSRLYLLNARDILYLFKIIKNQCFFDRLVDAIPFHTMENKKRVSDLQLLLLNFYLRIIATSQDEIGTLMHDPINSLNHLIESCYWDMCSLVNTANSIGFPVSLFEKLMTITMTYHMSKRPLTQKSITEIQVSLVSQILNLPDLKEEAASKEFDAYLKAYKKHAEPILENLKKLGILELPSVMPMASKLLLDHSKVITFKSKSAAIVDFFNERYNHFYADKIEAERKAKEEAQNQKQSELSQKEAILRKTLKEKTITSQIGILEKVKAEIASDKHSINKASTLQSQLERLESLHQKTLDFSTYSQKLRDKFTKTYKNIQALLAMKSTNTIEPSSHAIPNPLVPTSSSSEKTNMKTEIMQNLETREALKAQKEMDAKAKQEIRAQARAPKRIDYEEAQAQIPAPLLEPPVIEVRKLETIHSFDNDVTENIFTSQSDQYAGKAVFLLNLINSSKSLPEIRSQITHGQNLEPMIGQAIKVQDIKYPLQQYSLRVNDQYRITFYWDKAGKNAYHVWFGDYHA